MKIITKILVLFIALALASCTKRSTVETTPHTKKDKNTSDSEQNATDGSTVIDVPLPDPEVIDDGKIHFLVSNSQGPDIDFSVSWIGNDHSVDSKYKFKTLSKITD